MFHFRSGDTTKSMNPNLVHRSPLLDSIVAAANGQARHGNYFAGDRHMVAVTEDPSGTWVRINSPLTPVDRDNGIAINVPSICDDDKTRYVPKARSAAFNPGSSLIFKEFPPPRTPQDPSERYPYRTVVGPKAAEAALDPREVKFAEPQVIEIESKGSYTR